jgi:hypothetical protein
MTHYRNELGCEMVVHLHRSGSQAAPLQHSTRGHRERPALRRGCVYDGYGDRLPTPKYEVLLQQTLRPPWLLGHHRRRDVHEDSGRKLCFERAWRAAWLTVRSCGPQCSSELLSRLVNGDRLDTGGGTPLDEALRRLNGSRNNRATERDSRPLRRSGCLARLCCRVGLWVVDSFESRIATRCRILL